MCPLYFINGRVWHRDRFASVSRVVRSSEMQDGCIGSDVTRGWPLFDREPHYVYFHEPVSMLRQLQLSPIALVFMSRPLYRLLLKNKQTSRTVFEVLVLNKLHKELK